MYNFTIFTFLLIISIFLLNCNNITDKRMIVDDLQIDNTNKNIQYNKSRIFPQLEFSKIPERNYFTNYYEIENFWEIYDFLVNKPVNNNTATQYTSINKILLDLGIKIKNSDTKVYISHIKWNKFVLGNFNYYNFLSPYKNLIQSEHKLKTNEEIALISFGYYHNYFANYSKWENNNFDILDNATNTYDHCINKFPKIELNMEMIISFNIDNYLSNISHQDKGLYSFHISEQLAEMLSLHYLNLAKPKFISSNPFYMYVYTLKTFEYFGYRTGSNLRDSLVFCGKEQKEYLDFLYFGFSRKFCKECPTEILLLIKQFHNDYNNELTFDEIYKIRKIAGNNIQNKFNIYLKNKTNKNKIKLFFCLVDFIWTFKVTLKNGDIDTIQIYTDNIFT